MYFNEYYLNFINLTNEMSSCPTWNFEPSPVFFPEEIFKYHTAIFASLFSFEPICKKYYKASNRVSNLEQQNF